MFHAAQSARSHPQVVKIPMLCRGPSRLILTHEAEVALVKFRHRNHRFGKRPASETRAPVSWVKVVRVQLVGFILQAQMLGFIPRVAKY